MSNLQELIEQKNNHECTPRCIEGGSCFFLEDINQEIYTLTQDEEPMIGWHLSRESGKTGDVIL